MDDTREKMNRLFDELDIKPMDTMDYLIDFEKFVLIKKLLEVRDIKDLRRTFKVFSLLIKFGHYGKPISKRLNYLRNAINRSY